MEWEEQASPTGHDEKETNEKANYLPLVMIVTPAGNVHCTDLVRRPVLPYRNSIPSFVKKEPKKEPAANSI
jgi:hypothetical protein